MTKRYPKYKNSGIDWIGEIPEDWQLIKLKNISVMRLSSVDRHIYKDELQVPICHYPQAYKNEKIDRSTKLSKGSCTEDEFNKFKLERGDVIITKDSESADDIGVPTLVEEELENAVCGYHLALITPNSNRILGAFLFRYFQTEKIRKFFEINANGVTRFGLSKSTIENLIVLNPSRSEQYLITTYLDQKTTQIDLLIKKKAEQLDLLQEYRQAVINEAVTRGLNPEAPMRDSGVEWLGEVPAHWEVKKLKYLANLQGRIGFKGYTKDDLVNQGEGALTIGAKHINSEQKLDLSSPEYISWEKYYESPEIMINKNDIVFTQRGSLGKVAIIDRDIGPATINPSMVIINRHQIDHQFLYHSLRSNVTQLQVEFIKSATAVPMISQGQLSNFIIVVPPEDEQSLISGFLAEKEKKFRDLTLLLKKQIKKLQFYRQALISEVVTGKIDVREAVIKE